MQKLFVGAMVLLICTGPAVAEADSLGKAEIYHSLQEKKEAGLMSRIGVPGKT